MDIPKKLVIFVLMANCCSRTIIMNKQISRVLGKTQHPDKNYPQKVFIFHSSVFQWWKWSSLELTGGDKKVIPCTIEIYRQLCPCKTSQVYLHLHVTLEEIWSTGYIQEVPWLFGEQMLLQVYNFNVFFLYNSISQISWRFLETFMFSSGKLLTK